jgi:hypothetical protein
MPNELLLKTLVERDKYNEEAITTAIAEAEVRGLPIPEAVAQSVQKHSGLKQFLQKAQITDQAAENEGLLDASIIRKEAVSNSLALKSVLGGFVLLSSLELVGNWVDIGALLNSPEGGLLLAIPIIITVGVVVGLWKGFRPAFYLGAGMIAMAGLGWLLEISSLFRDPANDPGGFLGSFYYEYHTVFSFWFLLMILKLLVLLGTGWLLCQRVIYKHCGMTQNTVPLAFLFGAIGLYFLHFIVSSLHYTFY